MNVDYPNVHLSLLPLTQYETQVETIWISMLFHFHFLLFLFPFLLYSCFYKLILSFFTRGIPTSIIAYRNKRFVHTDYTEARKKRAAKTTKQQELEFWLRTLSSEPS